MYEIKCLFYSDLEPFLSNTPRNLAFSRNLAFLRNLILEKNDTFRILWNIAIASKRLQISSLFFKHDIHQVISL